MRPLQPSVRESLEAATVTFQHNLKEEGGEVAVEYLRDERGIDPSSPEGGEAIDYFRLGYVGEELPGFERFLGRLVIPNICASGHVVHMKFRAMDDAEPKYDAVSLPQRLFNLQALNDAGPVLYITEGEVDAISLAMLGAPCVAIPGVNLWKSHHSRVLEGFDRIVLVQDADDAGDGLADKLRRTELPVLTVRPPKSFKDVNAALAAGRSDDLLELLERTSK